MNRIGMKTRPSRRQGFFAALFAAGLALFALNIAFAQNGAAKREGVILSLNGPVTPANAGYLAREIKAASDARKELVIVEIDTPGGLVDSMHTIVKAVRASETPVATFVYPEGARSASAGLYIMYAAHVSAMAPSTNTGAATPVNMGGESDDESPKAPDATPSDEPADAAPAPVPTPAVEPSGAERAAGAAADALDDIRPSATDPADAGPLSSSDALRAKQINDSVAYIRALAEATGRNADWAEKAVREAVSVSANEALKLGAIDLIATSMDDLLAKIDGRTVKTAAGPVKLATKDLSLTRVQPTFVERILGFLSDPNVAVILMSLATTGLIIEMWNPGSILPGVMGLTCLILGLYAFQVLPYSWLGAALMLAGAIFIAVEAYTPTLGLVGLAGLSLFGAGAYLVFPDTFRVSTSVIATILVAVGAFLGVVLMAVAGSRSHGPLIGAEAIRRREGIVDEWHGREGWVIVEGERWRARADKPLSKGDRVKVVEIDGLVLVVRQAKGGLLPSGGARTAEA
jgi:membrane-bound serine protease (ClpP class)